jgi:hypothetical protein
MLFAKPMIQILKTKTNYILKEEVKDVIVGRSTYEEIQTHF